MSGHCGRTGTGEADSSLLYTLYSLYPIANLPRSIPLFLTCLIMHSGHAFLAALSLSLTQCPSASFYLKDKWVGDDFFRDWNWEAKNNPTHGRVNYVSQAEAIAKNLSYGTSSSRFSLIPLDIQIHLTGTSSVENNSLCVPAIGPSSIPPLVGVIASASLRRTRMANRYSCLTSRTCLRAVPPGLPFGRRARKVHGLTAGKLTSLKARFSSLSPPFRVTHTRCLRVLLPCRCQFARYKSSHSAYYPGLPNASRSTAPAAVWVGPYFVYRLAF